MVQGGASSGQVGLADYRLLRDTCPSSEEDASIGGTAPKPPNKDAIPPRPEAGASCHDLVKSIGCYIWPILDLFSN